VKIRGLIEDMVAKLQKEAAEDATHQAFCDEEMGKSKKQQEIKSGAQDKHKARMDSAATTIAKLTQAVRTLESELAEIDRAQGEATQLREKEHADYVQASGDYRGSAEAVARAVEVLKNYYEGGDAAASFVQVKARRSEDGEDAAVASTGSEAGGVIIQVLEMAQEDFTNLLAESEASEAEAAEQYEKLTQENKLAKLTKSMDVKGKQSEVKSLQVKLEHSTEDFDSVSKELDAVNMYLQKLRPECESKGMSAAEKKAAREAELAGLKEALSILSGDGI